MKAALDGLPSAEVEYQQRAISCGSGEPIALRGAPVLLVRFDGAVAHDSRGRLSVGASHFNLPCKAVLQVKLTRNSEAELTWGLGISGQKPSRVAAWSRPPRLVADVGLVGLWLDRARPDLGFLHGTDGATPARPPT